MTTDEPKRIYDATGAIDASVSEDAAKPDAAPVDATIVYAPVNADVRIAEPVDDPAICHSETACALLAPEKRPPCCADYNIPAPYTAGDEPALYAASDNDADADWTFACTRLLYASPTLARCFRDPDECETFSLSDDGWDVCVGVDVAVCFKARRVIDRLKGDFCFSTISACQDVRKLMAKDQRDVKILSKCKVDRR